MTATIVTRQPEAAAQVVALAVNVGGCAVTKRKMAMAIVGLSVFDLAMLALIVALWGVC